MKLGETAGVVEVDPGARPERTVGVPPDAHPRALRGIGRPALERVGDERVDALLGAADPLEMGLVILAGQAVGIVERRPIGVLAGHGVVVDQVALAGRPARSEQGAIAAADRVARPAVVPDAVGRGGRRARIDDVRQERARRDVVEERVSGSERRVPLRAVGVADREVSHRAVDVRVFRAGIVDRPEVPVLREVGGRPLEEEAIYRAGAVLVAADQPHQAPADEVGAVDARARGARDVDGKARPADSGDGAFEEQSVIARRPGDEVLAARGAVADALPRRDRHADGIGVVVTDARHRVILPDQVAVGCGVDLDAVAAVAGGGLPVGEQADVVALDRDVRGVERDARVAGADQRERPEDRAVGARVEGQPGGPAVVDGHDRRPGERRGRGAVDGDRAGDCRERGCADPDRAGDVEIDDVEARDRVGLEDRLAEGPRPSIAEVRHRERRQELSPLQDLDAANLRMHARPAPRPRALGRGGGSGTDRGTGRHHG